MIEEDAHLARGHHSVVQSSILRISHLLMGIQSVLLSHSAHFVLVFSGGAV